MLLVLSAMLPVLASCSGTMPTHRSAVQHAHYASTSNRCQQSSEVRQRITVSSFPVHAMDVRIGFNPDVYQSCMQAAGYKTVTVETAP